MSTIDWPAGLIPQSCSLQLRKAGQYWSSPFNGNPQATDYMSERWVLSVQLAELQRKDPRGVESFLNFMAGGVNRVRGWHFGQRGAPRGTLRSTPTLGAPAAQGATTLQLAGCTGTNRILNGGFDVDLGSGIANGWIAYDVGATGTVTRDTVVVAPGDRVQRVFASALGSGNAGVRLNNYAAVTAGQTYTFSADVATGSGGVRIDVYVQWNSGATVVGDSRASVTPLDGNYRRVAVTAEAPATADRAYLYLFMTNGAGVGASLYLDRAQFSEGAVSAWTPTTVLSDDLVGLSTGQLVQVIGDTAVADDGSATVQITSHLRQAVSSGTPVTTMKPTAEFVLPGMQAGVVWAPGKIQGAAIDLVEA